MKPVTDWGGKSTKVSFRSDKKGEKWVFPFEGTRVAVWGRTFHNGGYAHIRIQNETGETVYGNLINFYSKVEDNGLRFVSPLLPAGKYTLEVECAGEHPQWSDKRRNHYGSMEDWVLVNEIRVYE